MPKRKTSIAAPPVAVLLHRRGYSVWQTGRVYSVLCERHGTRKFPESVEQADQGGERSQEWCEGCRLDAARRQPTSKDKTDAVVLDEIGRVVFAVGSSRDKVKQIEQLLASLMED